MSKRPLSYNCNTIDKKEVGHIPNVPTGTTNNFLAISSLALYILAILIGSETFNKREEARKHLATSFLSPHQ